MSLALIAIVLAIGAGAVLAVSTREPAAVAIGLAVALVAAALLSDPLPSAAILGVRVVAALLVATLIRSATAVPGPRQPSPLGWPAEALLATAAAAAGIGLAVGLAAVAGGDGTPLGIGPDGGPGAGGPGGAAINVMAMQVAGGAMLLALGAAPLLHGRPGARRAIGLVLIAQAVILMRLGIAGPGVELEEIARAALLVACGATGAAMSRAVAAHEAPTPGQP